MAIANDLYPPIDAAVELETIGFDFGPALNAGVTVTAILSVTCAVHPGSIGSDPGIVSLLIFCFLVGAGGVALIIHAIRR